MDSVDLQPPSSAFEAEETNEDENLINQMTCCIITKQTDEVLTTCTKFAFSPLTKQLVDAITRKHLPFYYYTQRSASKLICLSHRKLVLSIAKYNTETTKLNLVQYDVGEAKEMQEFVEKFTAYKQEINGFNTKETSKKPSLPENYHNLWKRYRDVQEEYDASSSGDAQTKKQKFANQEGSTELKTNFDGLSAITLRRYKKFFKMGQRTGASKSQLVEEVRDHFESLPVSQMETSAYFMYTLKNKKNRLDHQQNNTSD